MFRIDICSALSDCCIYEWLPDGLMSVLDRRRREEDKRLDAESVQISK